MKRTIYLGAIALAALTMTNCSNDESVYSAATETQKAIGFETYATRPNQSRGVPTNTTALQADGAGFGVIAYNTATDWATNGANAGGHLTKIPLFYQQQVTYSTSSKWVYSPMKLWPEKGKVSFFAYAPYTNDNMTLSEKKATGSPKITYTTSSVVNEMVDVVTACQLDQEYTSNTSTNGQVDFTFEHALSKLDIKVKQAKGYDDKSTEMKINLTSITIKVPKAANLYNKAVLDLENSTWDYTLGTQFNGDLTLPSINKKTSSETDTYATPGFILTEKAQDPFETASTNFDNSLYLIPSSTSAEINGEKMTATVEYDVVTKDAGKKTWSSNSVTKKVNLTNFPKLEKGKAYSLTFTISVNLITFAASLTDWTTDSDGAVDIK